MGLLRQAFGLSQFDPPYEVCQADRLIDQFFKLNIEQALPDLPPASIDLLLCLDVLEHLVDVVLSFDGQRSGGPRVVRALKNRFGASGELAVPSVALSYLANEGISFTVVGPAPYERLASLRDSGATAV